ncbi:MAG: AAA family ATPase [Leptolyngbyaceae cyanobacterium SM1_3_5]|nr:AAA family ATPase [Leptolyngbyaceae cyanobacterium SM1_3_5]
MLKLAVVGKGGSGKSTLSWLLIQYLANLKQLVLGIDADYNMNLLSNLGLDYSAEVPTLHHSHQQFRQFIGLTENESWGMLKDRKLPQFSINPDDEYTASLTLQVSEQIKLIVVGLGDEDVLDSLLCGHGQVAPLKWYLPNLETNGTTVVIDSVAGTDMLNYNLYQGCDALIGVVENHRNSIRVLQQIQQTADRLNLPFYVVCNQSVEESIATEILSRWDKQLLGNLPHDEAIAPTIILKLVRKLKTASIRFGDR